jgi:hypothetical protein
VHSTVLPSSLRDVLFNFTHCFTAPSFENFVTWVCGWILCQGRHTVSGAIIAARAVGLGQCHHASIYRLASRARWSVDDLSHVLFRLLLPFLPLEISISIDDTLCRRSGPQIFGAGMHHDATRSTYGGAGGRQVAFSFGHNWVVLSVRVVMPWNPERAIGVPVLFRLYRSKKLCPKGLYKKRTELARELLRIACTWLPQGRRLRLSADQEYGCKTLLRDLPVQVEFCGGMPLNAKLFDSRVQRRHRLGRPPSMGPRTRSPSAWFEEPIGSWKRVPIRLYEKDVTLRIQTFVALWWTVRGAHPVRVVVTRDPKRRYKNRAFFCTNPNRSAEEILQQIAGRWSLETTFQAGKEHLGIDEPRNGWWRRAAGKRRPRDKAGAQPGGTKGRAAAERTVPLIFITYGIVVAWYLARGKPEKDVARARRLRPWDTQKADVCYVDMLAAIRRELWVGSISATPSPGGIRRKLTRLLPVLGAAA